MKPKRSVPDPSTVRNATILFCDIRGSSALAETTDLDEYDEIISEYHKCMKSLLAPVVKRQSDLEWSIRGDETCLILYTGNEDEDVENALRIAIGMIRAWFESKINRRRILEEKEPLYIGVGIHHGPVTVRKHPASERRKNAEGYAINLAKRIEGCTREARYSKIMVSLTVYDRVAGSGTLLERKLSERIEFSKPILKNLQGISQPVYLFEVKSFGNLERDIDRIEKNHFVIVNTKNSRVFQKAVETSPSVWTCSALGNYYYQRAISEKKPEKKHKLLNDAIRYYQRTLMIESNHGPSLYNLALCLWLQGRVRLAIEQLNSVLQTNPLDREALCFKGICLNAIGDYEQSLHAFEKSLEITPDSLRVAMNVVEMSIRLDCFERAGSLLDEFGPRIKPFGSEYLICKFMLLLFAHVNDLEETYSELMQDSRRNLDRLRKAKLERFSINDLCELVNAKTKERGWDEERDEKRAKRARDLVRFYEHFKS